MMSFSVDQFMQVKCKFQLTSESESSESIYSNNERIRLSASAEVDEKSSIVVMICSNDTGNNHIVAYYIGSRTIVSNKSIDTSTIHETSGSNNTNNNNIITNSTNNNTTTNSISGTPSDRKLSKSNHSVTFTQFAHVTSQNSPHPSVNSSSCSTITKIKPRVIVKQIYYHSYNEDIAAINLSDHGNRLVLISMSSTIYIIPLKNILLNLYAKQLRSSQGKSMYFYDASIIDCCSISSPVSICIWENCIENNLGKTTIIVGNEHGELSFISVEDKKEINLTSINEPIRQMKVIRDRFSHSLLITSESFRQYRFILELIRQQELSPDLTPTYLRIYNDEYAHIEKDFLNIWDGKPIPIKLQNSNFINTSSKNSVLQRVFVPSSRAANQAKIISNIHTRERSLQLMFCHSTSVLSIVDILRSSKVNSSSTKSSNEPRLLRFYSTKNYYYRPQKPMFVCRLTSLENDEMITHVVITDRFLAVATDKNRCLINSRNCCDMKNPSAAFDLDPLVKEIKFNSEENILDLFKSPVSNDQDGIIDSFLLITNRSIYSIEARQSCRDMYVNLIDGHLSIKLDPPKDGLIDGSVFGTSNCATQRKSSDTNHMINSFLNMREDIYDRITFDSRAFSALYKLALNSLYEAYADRLLLREQYCLANRFYQMATFSHMKILGKYLRLEWSRLSPAQKEANRDIWLKSQENTEFESLSNGKSFSSRALLNATLGQLELFRKLVSSGQESQELRPKTLLGQHKQLIWNIFNEALNTYLDESTEDSCRLWFNYINFYLNYVGDIDELECDILELLGSSASDYRLALTLYKAVERDEPGSSAKPFSSEEVVANTPLDSMGKLYNLSQLFKNEFLMRLLERTLDACESSSHGLCIS